MPIEFVPRLGHRRIRPFFHGRARPHRHLAAVARIGEVSVAVDRGEHGRVAQRLRRVIRQHLFVARHIARAQHHAVGGVDTNDAALLVGGVHARHALAFFDKLLAFDLESGFGPRFERGVERGMHGPSVVGQQMHHAGKARIVLFAPMVIGIDRATLGKNIGGFGVARRIVVAFEQFVIGRSDVPVEVGAGIGDPVIEQASVGPVAHHAHELVDHLLGGRLLDAELLVDFAAECAEFARSVSHIGAFVDADDLRTRLGGLAQGAYARKAQTHDADVHVDRLHDRRFVDRHGSVEERGPVFRRIRLSLRRRPFCLLGRLLRSAARQAGACNRRGAEAEKRPSAHIVSFHGSLLHSRIDASCIMGASCFRRPRG